MQDPAAAADELQRAVKDLKFRGALINGQTNGVYLDDPQYDPFWAMAEELGVPFLGEVPIVTSLRVQADEGRIGAA